MSARWKWLAAGVAVWLWLGHGAAAKSGAPSPPWMCPATGDVLNSERSRSHLVPVDESIGALLREGTRRSQTLAWLVEHLETLNGRVYLFAGVYRRPAQGLMLRGGTSHEVTGTGGFRIVKSIVQPGLGDRTIATIGHELRHAVEILEDADTTDVKSVTGLYERIGFKVQTGVYETHAALATGEQVYNDLKRCKP